MVQVLLLVENSPDDAFLFTRALSRCRPNLMVSHVDSAAAAQDYLQGRGKYGDRQAHPYPNFIVVNNSIAFKSENFLEWLNHHPKCGVIPLIILSGSDDPRDVATGYRRGAHTYFRKTADNWDDLVRTIFDYWEKAVVPPPPQPEEASR